MLFIYSLSCYYNQQINVYKNRTIIGLQSYYQASQIENDVKLQQLCASQLPGHLNVTLLDQQNKLIASFDLVATLFPTVQIELNESMLISATKDTFQQLSKKIALSKYILYTINSVDMLQSSATSIQIKESLDDVQPVVKSSQTTMIIAVSASVSALVILTLISTLLWCSKKKKIVKQQLSQREQISRYQNASKALFEKKLNKSSSQISQLNPKILNDSKVHSRVQTDDEQDEPISQTLNNGTKEFPLQIPSSLQESHLKCEETRDSVSDEVVEVKTDILTFLMNKDIKVDVVEKKKEVVVPVVTNVINSLKQDIAKKDDPMSALFSKLGINRSVM
ncbi:Hypothetical_protein [Hexamita inflata]|uniref:Hypothetical_protein n=1 Tax=Hexamita inflata TaxID=28002 RepID=A0AA86QUC1_9EUKA|nr:Hypothetical protein HINF_LOCUS49301 [Hexamita inflata]